MTEREKIRNIAIIAHVDHGKTTLVDAMLKQCGTFRENEQVDERVMDSNDLEKERGITILAKNTSLDYNGYKINIIDTPGHADFGGEVERGLEMVDGVLLLVDAFEGCMPQTRFVLSKSLALGLKPIIVVNKVDRPNARPYEVVDEVLELFIDLGATDEQLDTPVIYASGRDGWATAEYNPERPKEDLKDMFDLIVDYIPCPDSTDDGPFQMLVSNIDYDEYTGRIAVGKIERGKITTGMSLAVIKPDGKQLSGKAVKLYTFDALNKAVADGCRILNMSFGSASESYSILDAVNDAASKGVLMFAAAGNDGNDTINYPAGYSKVTGVGSTSKGKTRSSFSNYNSSVFVVAPGGAVPVDVEVKVSGDWSVTRLSGTSFSTPTVAAVAALCLSMNKNLDTASFQELLKNTSTDLGDTGWDNYYGYGIINGEKLFKSLFAVPSKEDANGKTEYTVYIEGITEGDKGIMLFKSDKGVNAGGFTAKDGMVTATFSCKVTVPETVFLWDEKLSPIKRID